MAASNTFFNVADVEGPAVNATAVTTSDSADLSYVTRGIYVGGSGNLKVDMLGGGSVTFTGLAAGVIHPIRATRIYATGTTATGVIALW